jgi:ADP-ribose pyrophosphatase YjhB (NUDIX family)
MPAVRKLTEDEVREIENKVKGRLMDLTTRYYGEALGLPPAEVRGRLAQELGHATPKLGADAAIFNAAGEILLVLRADDQRWCLPCGWVEPHESPAEAAVRETREETGLAVQPTKLVDVFYRPAGIYAGAHALVAVVYLCAVVGGSLTLSHEHRDARYWPIDAVRAWHANHRDYAVAAHAIWRDGVAG